MTVSSADAGRPAPARRSLAGRSWHYASPLIGFLLVLLIWELAARALDNRNILPDPWATAQAAWRLLENGTLLTDIGASLSRVLQGWAIAVVVAIPLGGAMGRIEGIRRVVHPVIEVIRPIPPIAMIPIAILWFGIGSLSQLFIVFYGAFFPMVIGVYDAFRGVNRLYEQAARSLGTRGLPLFGRVTVMAALPNVISSLRIGLGLAFVSLVAAELIAASSGLGALIANARVTFQTDHVLVGMIAIGLVGFTLGWVMSRLERWLVRW